jgi:hypothetical protein
VSSFKETTILKSFEATGIAPLNPDVILKRFTSNHPDEQESRESSTSVLSASDWRKLDRLVKVSAKSSKSEECKKLSRSFHAISTHIQLLQHDVEGLRQALVVKKKQHARGKPLDLQQRKEYHGGAVIWSPRKVREARARQVIKERDEEEEKQKKAERAKVRAANKLLKEKLDRQKQERRVEREKAKAAKEKEKADRVAERDRQREAQNAKKPIKLSQRGKRKALQPLEQNIKRKKQVVDAVGGEEALGVASAALPVTTRRGRNVRRFQVDTSRAS